MRYPPCKKDGAECPRRQPGCQATCPDMKPFYEGLAAERAAERKEAFFRSYEADSKKRLRKYECPLPGVVLRNKKKRKERSGAYDAKVKKIIEPGGSGNSG